jgi:biopolymer transport protein ExbB
MQALMNFVTNEWYYFTPLALMSLTAVTLVIWRILLNLDARTNLNQFLPQFQDKLEKEGADAALVFCRKSQGLIAKKLFPAGLETRAQGTSAMRRAMANAIELEILPDLNFLLPPILAIAKIATMVGLFFTVISMINTFSAISEAAKGNNPGGVTAQAGAIGLALFATAMGLMTAIPLVFAHVLFKDWIGRYELKMKGAAQKLLVVVQNTKGGPTSRPNVVAPAVPVVAGS